MSETPVARFEDGTASDVKPKQSIDGYIEQTDREVLVGIQTRLAQDCEELESRLPKIKKNIYSFSAFTIGFLVLGVYLGLKTAQDTEVSTLNAVMLLVAPAVVSLLLASYSSLRLIKTQNLLNECRAALIGITDKLKSEDSLSSYEDED